MFCKWSWISICFEAEIRVLISKVSYFPKNIHLCMFVTRTNLPKQIYDWFAMSFIHVHIFDAVLSYLFNFFFLILMLLWMKIEIIGLVSWNLSSQVTQGCFPPSFPFPSLVLILFARSSPSVLTFLIWSYYWMCSLIFTFPKSSMYILLIFFFFTISYILERDKL